MADDTTSVEYKCPFCYRTKPTEKRVRQHIDSKMDEAHRGESYDTDRTIDTVYKGGNLMPENRELYGQIEEAARKVDAGVVEEIDELDNEGIKKIAEEADVSNSFVLRVLMEEDIPHNWVGRKIYSPDQLSEKQKEILKIWHNKGRPKIDKDNRKRGESALSDITENSSYGSKSYPSVRNNIKSYGWMLDYDKEDIVGNGGEHNGEIITEGIDEAVEEFVTDDGKEEDVEEEKDISPLLDFDETEKLDNALTLREVGVDVDVEVSVEVVGADFDAVKELIKRGEDELAEHVNKYVD